MFKNLTRDFQTASPDFGSRNCLKVPALHVIEKQKKKTHIKWAILAGPVAMLTGDVNGQCLYPNQMVSWC